jgi:hypothetical protein
MAMTNEQAIEALPRLSSGVIPIAEGVPSHKIPSGWELQLVKGKRDDE